MEPHDVQQSITDLQEKEETTKENLRLRAELEKLGSEMTELKTQFETEKGQLIKSESRWKERAEALAMAVSIYEVSLLDFQNRVDAQQESVKNSEDAVSSDSRVHALEKEKEELTQKMDTLRAEWIESESAWKREHERQIQEKEEEINKLRQQISLQRSSKSEEVDALRRELQEQRGISQRTEASLHSVEEKYELASEQVEKLRKEILQYQDQLGKLRLQAEILEAEKNGIEQSARQESQQYKEHERVERQRLDGVIDSQKLRIAQLEEQLRSSEASCMELQCRCDKLVPDNEQYRLKVRELENELEEQAQSRGSLKRQVDALLQSASVSEEELSHAREEVEAKNQELQASVARSVALEMSIKSLREAERKKRLEVENLQTQLKDMEKQSEAARNEMKGEYEKLTKENDELQNQVTEQLKVINDYSVRYKRMDSELQEVKSLLEKEQEELKAKEVLISQLCSEKEALLTSYDAKRNELLSQHQSEKEQLLSQLTDQKKVH